MDSRMGAAGRQAVVAGPVRAVPPVGWWELFERHAEVWPSDVALVADGRKWTFRELDRWSNRLGRALREAGAGPGTIVACALTRSVRAMVGLLAVAKTGAAYLPVDPDLPPARAKVVLADADPVVVLTDVPAQVGVGVRMVLDVENRQADLDGYSDRPLYQAVDGPAYVIYTSGSTGTPKGVVVGNASLVNLYRELVARYFPIVGRGARVAHGLPLAFDASFDPLLWMVGGHEVHLVPDDVRADPEQYVRFVAERRISVVETVPAHLLALAEAGLLEPGTRPGLLLVGGEAACQEMWSRLRTTPGLAAVNLYGPTECAVFATACRLDECDTPSIGRPIGNTRVRIVDDRLRPVPQGAPGELLIGGRCVAEGYLNRPELTAERFVDGWYRTGDLCRAGAGGRLEWLGRLDDQVKIRGHRVEPGETEHVLRGLPQVRQAVVRVEGTCVDRRLVAYVVPVPGADVTGVRELLREALPGYLVPSAVVPVAEMPVGHNGKIDREALFAPPVEPADRMSPEQELVADVFRAVLGDAEAVTADSDFLELGGHSLSAAAIASRLRAAGVPCSLRDVLNLRTVARLALLVPGFRLDAVKES